MEPAWYVWAGITVVALLYLLLCYKCIASDVKTLGRSVHALLFKGSESASELLPTEKS
jgi:hypothetical protein